MRGRSYVLIVASVMCLAPVFQSPPSAVAQQTFPQGNFWARVTPSIFWCGDPESKVTIEVHIVGRNDVAKVQIADQREDNRLTLYDDGTHGDSVAGDNTFTLSGASLSCECAWWPYTVKFGIGSRAASLRVTLKDGTEMGYDYSINYGYSCSGLKNTYAVRDFGGGLSATDYAFFINDSRHEVFDGYPVASVYCGTPNYEAYRKLYSIFPDVFDLAFLMPGEHIFRTDTLYENVPYNVLVSNAVKHMGLRLMDDSADFGSAGRLNSVVYHSFGGNVAIADHEIAHTWGAAIGASLGLIDEGLPGQYHWNMMSDIGGQLGAYYFDSSGKVGHFSYNGDNTWRFILNSTNEQYSPLELYIMGLVSLQEVPPIHILTAPDLSNTERITAGSVRTVTIDDIIAAEGGEREPSSASSRKDFNLAFIVTDDRPYNDAAYAFFSALSRSMMTHDEPVRLDNYAPFYWATGGRATLNTGLPVSGSPPAEATLISPSGSIATTSPEYRWNAVASATSYYLWVSDGSASPRLKQSFTATQAGCASGSGTCSVTPAVTLPSGACQWWIETRNYAGYGSWSTPLSFTVTAGATAKTTMYFAQLAVGGGYTTAFTFVNTGADASSGSLTLTGDDGTPLKATLASPSQGNIVDSSYSISVPRGGIQSITASGVSPGDATKVGWARVESSGGSLGGVATFQFMNGDSLTINAGVLSGSATISATIPIDDDLTLGAQSHSTGYAVANPGKDDLYISLTVTNSDGSIAKTIYPPTLNPLGPGCHSARFFWQDLDPNWQFKGSITLSAGAGQTFSVVALVVNQGLVTAIPVVSPLSQPGESTTTNLFAQIAVGGGFTTNFTLLNTGTDAASGTMTLSGDDGAPLNSTLSSSAQGNTAASSYSVSVPPGGTQSITASGVNPADATKAGSAGVESSGGSLQGVATFQLMDGNKLTTIVGVLSSGATNSATIPIDDDLTLGAQSRSTGYAVANPGKEDIRIRLLVINPDGSISKTIYPSSLNPLRPGCHSAGFFWEDLADDKLKFRGSVVLIADSEKSFSVVALVLDHGLCSAVPVIPGKATGFN